MSSDLDLLEMREEQRQKHRKRRQDKKGHRKNTNSAEVHKPHKLNQLPLVSDPLDEYFEYYLPCQSRCSGRLKPHKRRLSVS